jgi:hypothetical protein
MCLHRTAVLLSTSYQTSTCTNLRLHCNHSTTPHHRTQQTKSPTQNSQCECANVTAPCRSRGKHQAKKHIVIKHHDDWIVASQKSKCQPVNRCLVSSFTPVLVTCFDPRLRGRSDCSKWQITHESTPTIYPHATINITPAAFR